VLVTYALLLSVVCVVWVPRKLDTPGETKRITARYALLWKLQDPPKDLVAYERYDEFVEQIAQAALDSSQKADGQAKLESAVEDLYIEYPEMKNRKGVPERPSDYIEPDLYRYATVDFGRLGLEIASLSALCCAGLILLRKPRRRNGADVLSR
jgi:hypothetical protein